ncbi:MAG: OmpA family protein [Fibromonadales bacterium]|nr:OmpA family protein [Fibromonadales bacterium]
MKIQSIVFLACAASLFAQDRVSCEIAFDEVKNVYPRDASADRLYASAYARIATLKNVKPEDRSGEVYNEEVANCDLAVELLKTQLAKVALRKNLDSLRKEISLVKDSLIDIWASDAKGAKSLNAALSDERNRLERLNKQKDSVLAAQKAEADKKLEALRSKTISVYKDARGTILSMSDILFETAKATLTQELQLNLAEVAAILKTLLTESTVIIEGHTDNVGKAEKNKTLSEQRAQAVLKYLVGRGVDKKRLRSVGYGATKPVADNNTDEGKAKNRRVELIIKDK